MNMSGRVFVKTEYGFDFLDKDGNVISELIFDSCEKRDTCYDQLDDPDDPRWPDGAMRISHTWSRDIYRLPILGIDYGPGSVKARFGGGYVPRKRRFEMVTIKCQHSGIEFEAKTRRTKQHPAIARFKSEMARDYYRQAMEALDEASKMSYSTIDAYMQLVQEIVDGKISAHDAALNKQRKADREAEKARADARAKRKETNIHLRQHGYTWYKDPEDGYQPAYDFGDNRWHLMSPDHYEVTVAEALAEIERGVDIVVAERDAKKKNREEAEARHEAKKESERKAHQEARDSVATIEVKPFDYSDFDLIYERKDYSVATSIERIFRGKLNGVSCGVTYSYFGGHDFNESERFWCDDPEVAGLTRVKRDELSQASADFFGA